MQLISFFFFLVLMSSLSNACGRGYRPQLCNWDRMGIFFCFFLLFFLPLQLLSRSSFFFFNELLGPDG